jgi:hypothetical protein
VTMTNGASNGHSDNQVDLVVSELEKAVPEVSVKFWNRVLGRNSEESQIDIENRIAKRGLAGIRKQVDYFAFLR